MELRNLYVKQQLITELYIEAGGKHETRLFADALQHTHRPIPTLRAYIRALALQLPAPHRLKFELNASKLLA